jgi:NADH:ubiquinone oxidoreductase subunit 3 (subunit A)
MKHLSELCLQIKLAAVELVSLIGFLGILGVGLYWEWQHLVALVRK